MRGSHRDEEAGQGVFRNEQLNLRQEQSAQVLHELREKLPKHPMAEAINYALGQWTELTVFCSDGAVPIDNNG